MRVLVVGGAGYIGSHVVYALKEAGEDVWILDDLSKGHREALRRIGLQDRLIKGSMDDKELVRQIIRDKKIEGVMHFAAKIEVGESMERPLLYFNHNVSKTISLLEAMLQEKVNKFIFSSSAAVYGMPERVPIDEEHPKSPVNVYGETKLMVEKILDWLDRTAGLKYAALRYFNAAGAHPEGLIGEDHDPETHLIPIVLQVALGKRDHVKIFGTDYPTPDGTAIRDYIHVMDLASAHILALEKLLKGERSLKLNLGNGNGFSVKEVIETARKITGKEIKAIEWERRKGDPAILVASSRKAQEILGWRPEYPDLSVIIEHAWKWHSANPNGYME